MKINSFETKQEMGIAAAKLGAEAIREAAKRKEKVTILVATGASQFSMLQQLVTEQGIPWERIEAFHLDEYVGLSDKHPASFRKYLQERFVDQLPELGQMNFVNADAEDLDNEIKRLNDLITGKEIDVCFAGIGENGHLAFNDPPADFETREPFILVELDEACRQQQCNEGWFPTLADVPTHAISMSIQQIFASKMVLLSVPGEQKAQAVKNTIDNEVSPLYPSTIMQKHTNCHLFLDDEAAKLL